MSKKDEKKAVKSAPDIEEPKYTVNNDIVSWEFRGQRVEMTLDQLDLIFYQYSKHGLNMSQVQVQNEHGFEACAWQNFKRTFELVKDSDIFSPYRVENTPREEYAAMLEERLTDRYSRKNMRKMVEYKDRKTTSKAYKKAIERAADLDHRFSLFETALLDYADQCKPKVIRTCKKARVESPIVHICDLHAGAEIKPSRNLPAYGWKQLEQKLDAVVQDANARGGKDVTVVVNGDMIESFTGMNHANSWQNLSHENGYGIGATVKVTDLLAKFISELNNVKEVIFISGNHDRATSSNKEDVTGEVARLIAYTLNAQFPFDISWEPEVVSRKIRGCGFVFTHGHLGLGKKVADLIVSQYGYKGMYNMVVMGHLHSRKTRSDTYDSRVIHAPSLFTGNNYSKGLGYSSRSGYLYIHVENKLPVVIDYPLP